METLQYVLLPDGSYAVIVRSITWGEAVIILLLVVLVFVKLYELWINHK